MNQVRLSELPFDISHPAKVMFPGAGLNKEAVVKFFCKVAPVMLPYMKDRPIALERFPDGVKGDGFFQKDVPDYFPDWIVREKITKEDGYLYQVICNDAKSLAYLASQACLTPHIWLSRRDRLNYPDRLIFDLDPTGDDFTEVTEAAKNLKQLLERLDLKPFVMTTGSKGLHVVVPLRREKEFDEVRAIADNIAKVLEEKYPDKYTTVARREKRQGKLYLDVARNAYAQTSVAPYSVRAREGAPVATPLDWPELNDKGLTSQKYRIGNIFRRLSQKSDPWQEIDRNKQSLSRVRELLKDF